MKHTKGKWRPIDLGVNDYGVSVWSVRTSTEGVAGEISSRDDFEAEANARLIAEAGTVANETGKTPRQLADERDELLKALKDLVDIVDRWKLGHHATPKRAKEAIKKATE